MVFLLLFLYICGYFVFLNCILHVLILDRNMSLTLHLRIQVQVCACVHVCVVKSPFMMRWVVRSILHGGSISCTSVTKAVVCIIMWDGDWKE